MAALRYRRISDSGNCVTFVTAGNIGPDAALRFLGLLCGSGHRSRLPERVVAFDASAIGLIVAMSARIDLQGAPQSP
jgi:hypothetical protein